MPTQPSPQFRVPDGEMMVNESGDHVPSYNFVSFYFDVRENAAASAAAGRKMFDRVLLVRWYYPGTKDYLDEELKRWRAGHDDGPGEVSAPHLMERFQKYVDAYEKNTTAPDIGTPIAVLNLSVTSEAELTANNITTIEALAQVPDAHLRNFTGGLDVRARARRYLAAQESEAPRLAAEAAADAAKAETAALKQEIAELRRELASQRTPAPAHAQEAAPMVPLRRRGG